MVAASQPSELRIHDLLLLFSVKMSKNSPVTVKRTASSQTDWMKKPEMNRNTRFEARLFSPT
jgi:hypothetical protein